MQSVPNFLARRLDRLKAQGIIAGWQDAGGPNYGLSRAPLPALIFPITANSSTSFYTPEALESAIFVLETFGPTEALRGG